MKHIFLVALTTILSTTLFGQNQIQIDFENDGKMGVMVKINGFF